MRILGLYIHSNLSINVLYPSLTIHSDRLIKSRVVPFIIFMNADQNNYEVVLQRNMITIFQYWIITLILAFFVVFINLLSYLLQWNDIATNILSMLPLYLILLDFTMFHRIKTRMELASEGWFMRQIIKNDIQHKTTQLSFDDKETYFALEVKMRNNYLKNKSLKYCKEKVFMAYLDSFSLNRPSTWFGR